LCDLCEEQGKVFLACSAACLDEHRATAHPESAGGSSAGRARTFARDLNRRYPDTWARYAGHRARLTKLVAELPRGGELCVFGAGNCNDLDLEAMSSWFKEIHLVDLDGEALERARDRQASRVRPKLVLHGEVDCSGLLEHLDDWGDRFPSRAELGQSAVQAAQGIVRGLGQGFSAVVSACVLSQLAVPFQRAWVTSRSNWGDLLSAISAVHLATLAGSTNAGGNGLLLIDSASSKECPELALQASKSDTELQDFVDSALESGTLALRPDPYQVLMQMSSPGLRTLVAEPSLSPPWIWNLGADAQLVYSLSFGHP
jgi:hypothetical protein